MEYYCIWVTVEILLQLASSYTWQFRRLLLPWSYVFNY